MTNRRLWSGNADPHPRLSYGPSAQRGGRHGDPGRDPGGAGRAGLVQADAGGCGDARRGRQDDSLPTLETGKNELVVDAVAELFGELELPDRGSLAADIEGVVLQFAAILARPEAKSGLMAAVAESTRDDALRERIRASIVDPQKDLVLEGRARAQARGELPPQADPAEAARTVDLIFDVVAGAVVHRTLVSAEPADEEWVRSFTRVLLLGLTASTDPSGDSGPSEDTGPSEDLPGEHV